jgi:hypothetical protein
LVEVINSHESTGLDEFMHQENAKEAELSKRTSQDKRDAELKCAQMHYLYHAYGEGSTKHIYKKDADGNWQTVGEGDPILDDSYETNERERKEARKQARADAKARVKAKAKEEKRMKRQMEWMARSKEMEGKGLIDNPWTLMITGLPPRTQKKQEPAAQEGPSTPNKKKFPQKAKSPRTSKTPQPPKRPPTAVPRRESSASAVAEYMKTSGLQVAKVRGRKKPELEPVQDLAVGPAEPLARTRYLSHQRSRHLTIQPSGVNEELAASDTLSQPTGARGAFEASHSFNKTILDYFELIHTFYREKMDSSQIVHMYRVRMPKVKMKIRTIAASIRRAMASVPSVTTTI